MTRLNRVAAHRRVRLKIDGVKIEPLCAGNLRQRNFQIRAQLIGVAGASRIIPAGLNAAGQIAVRILEAANIVALPALN